MTEQEKPETVTEADEKNHIPPSGDLPEFMAASEKPIEPFPAQWVTLTSPHSDPVKVQLDPIEKMDAALLQGQLTTKAGIMLFSNLINDKSLTELDKYIADNKGFVDPNDPVWVRMCAQHLTGKKVAPFVSGESSD